MLIWSRLRVRIVIRDVRAAERRDDSEPLQRRDERAGPHGLAVPRFRSHRTVRSAVFAEIVKASSRLISFTVTRGWHHFRPRHIARDRKSVV